MDLSDSKNGHVAVPSHALSRALSVVEVIDIDKSDVEESDEDSYVDESSDTHSTVTDTFEVQLAGLESESEPEVSATTPTTEVSDDEGAHVTNSTKRKRGSAAEIAELQHENADLRRKLIKVQRDLQTLEARVASCEATTQSAVSEVDHHWAYTKNNTMPLMKAMTGVAEVFAQHFPLEANDHTEE